MNIEQMIEYFKSEGIYMKYDAYSKILFVKAPIKTKTLAQIKNCRYYNKLDIKNIIVE